MQKHTASRSMTQTRELSTSQLALVSGGTANYRYGSADNTAFSNIANSGPIGGGNTGGSSKGSNSQNSAGG